MRYLLLAIPLSLCFLTSCKEVKKETQKEVKEELHHLKPHALEFGPGPEG